MPRNLIAIESRAVLALVPQTLISIRTFFWILPLSVLVTTFLAPLEINRVEDVIRWFWISVFGHFSMLPFVIYSRGKIGYGIQIPLLLMMGAVRGGVIGLLAPLFGVTDHLEIPGRVINSMTFIFYCFLVASIVFEFQTAFRRELTKKIKEVILKGALIDTKTPDVNSHELLLRINELKLRILETLNGVPTQEKLKARSKDIDRLVRKHIRPLSKSQWRDGELVWANAGFLKVITETLSLAPLHVWAVIFLSLPFSLVGQYNRYGLLNTFVTQLIWLFAVWILPKIAKKLFPAKDGDYLKQNLTIISLVIFLVTPTVYWMHSIWPGDIYTVQEQVVAHLFSAFSVTILLLASSVILSLQKESAAVFEYLSSAIRDKDLQDLIGTGLRANTESDYGQYLHAAVQSQLLACKLLLLKAAESDFTLFPPEITHQINQRLEQIQQPYQRPAARIPFERVSELATSWAGLSEVTYNLPSEMSELKSNSDVVSQLIEESVINSIRHGKATKIHIEGISSEALSSFVISDNGYFEEAQSSGGLGTILFNAFAETWSLTREGDQTILKFSVRN